MPHSLMKLYISHALTTWNSRTFEFGAVIFLAAIFPGTLFYASCYALIRSIAATILSSYIGNLVDRTDRLALIRQSIVWQRIPVAASCGVFVLLAKLRSSGFLTEMLFAVTVALACVEKLASMGNTIAVERDWLVVISESTVVDLQDLNATIRRIDLICKLVAPVVISFVDSYSTLVAIYVIMGQSTLSVLMEYFAIAQVYHSVPSLSHPKEPSTPDPTASSSRDRTSNPASTSPWRSYTHSPAFFASLSLSLLYLTVLSTGIQLTTYLLSLGYDSLSVSLMRLAAVAVELSATCLAPLLMARIGATRAGLWSVNWLLCWVGGGVVTFLGLGGNGMGAGAGAALVGGVVGSRLGLWGFDLAVQFLVQESTPAAHRGKFSAAEMALQNLFELLSFASTIVFSSPKTFKYPVLISCGAVAMSACCFAAFVRQKRGHLLHASKCLKRKEYVAVPQVELQELRLDEDVEHGRD
ncbi:hypothetical protein W97_09067 [Coniosporium apollinis CBS 100218]|uniref:Solute carrier family 40 member n=1 Tax=Coniosporium apollinis (strain CBS 100218) TaxID=1168221 RepID=R7Z713_CONA1|nr:uncharacterized protein W97_09067 [Coniosporium apollinis CBS 100218]EON69804.1 hypothetical protein W97_09067 [Coniosporium apollinis CBS 100218]